MFPFIYMEKKRERLIELGGVNELLIQPDTLSFGFLFLKPEY